MLQNINFIMVRGASISGNQDGLSGICAGLTGILGRQELNTPAQSVSMEFFAHSPRADTRQVIRHFGSWLHARAAFGDLTETEIALTVDN